MPKPTIAFITDRQLAANRANAKLSTGPKSEEGKRRSSQNALRHGLTGRVVVLPTEDTSAYLQFSKEIVESLRPETPIERNLAQTIADFQWRLNRVFPVENGMFAMGAAPPPADADPVPENLDHEAALIVEALSSAEAFRDNAKAFVNLSLYEQRLNRASSQALRQLEELQTKRRARTEYEMTMAIRLYKFHAMKDLKWNPKDDGFVYSNNEIAAENGRRIRAQNALHADYDHFDIEEYKKRLAA